MPRHKGIPPKHNNQILEWIGEGLSANKIHQRLNDELFVNVSVSTVHRLVRNLRHDYTEVARIKYATSVADSADKDLMILERLIDTIFHDYEEARVAKDRNAVKLADQLGKWIDRRIALLGIRDAKITEEKPEPVTGQSIMAALDTIAIPKPDDCKKN